MKRLQNLSYKTLLTIFIFSLAGIVFFLKIGGKTTKVSAAWWDDAWHYRVAVIITNNTGYDATNIPYKATLDTQTLISAGKLQSDADDIRVVDSNGNIVRSQVEKSTLNTTVTKVWFEATVKNSNSATYYIYYGNSTISAPNFTSDIQSFSNTSSSTTIQMKDGFSYSTTNTSGGRLADITKNSVDLGVDGNINYTNSYPGQWWLTSQTQTILNSTGPLFIEVVYSSGATGSYSAYESDVKVFDNGFSETRLFVTYNASGSEQFYYYLPFTNGTRNSVWVNGSGTLIDQAPDSGTLYQADLGQNWFGQRWTATGNYGGTIITKNGSDWYNGYTSAQASYFQTNYSTTLAFTSGSTREVRFGVFSGDGGLTEMAQKGANYGGLSSNLKTEEVSTAPISYWKFDEGTGSTIYDSSSLQNQGVTGGNTLPTWITDDSQCVSGKCLFFPGGGGWGAGSKVTASKQIPISGNFTISHWIKTSSNNGQMYTIANAGGGDGYRFGLNNGKIGFLVGNSSGYTEKTCGVRSLNDNTWHLITGVFDNTNHTFSCYADGKFEASTSIVDFTGMSTTAPGIGSPPCCQIFTGYIDDVKIYPYTRTATQIKNDYNSRGSLSGAGVNLGVKSNTGPSLKSSLIAYYKFDEGIGTTVYDSSPQKNLGYFVGTTLPTWSNNCKAGKCINFISTNSNNISTNVNYNNGSEYTISAYIYPTSISGTRVVLGTAMGNNIDAGLVVSGTSNICYHNYSGSGDTNYCSTNSPIILNTWQHVALSMKNNDINIYHNGVNVRNVSVGRTATTNFAIIGGASVDAYSGARYFNGSIDEVKIYNKALTADEIKQDYNANSAIQFGSTNQTIGGTTTSLDYCIPGDTSYCVPPVAEYNFEENTGTTAKDTSGGNNNGNFSSGSYAPTWSTGKNNTGSGIKFNGESNSSYINTSFPSTPPSSYTAEAWIKPFSTSSSLNPTLGYSILAASYDSTHYPLWITLRDGEITATSFSNAITPVSTLGANIQTNRWYHIAVSAVQNGPAIIYVNGIGKTSFTSSNIAWNSNDKLTIGELRPTRNISFNGIIDQVKIYDYARTPAQIAYDYNKGGPVGWWKLDECQGSTAFDASGLGNTGAISIGLSGSQTSLGTCQTGTSAAWTNGSSGHTNGSLNFDGTDDYMLIPYSPAWKNKDFTTSFWINPRAYTDIETGYGSHWFYSPEGFGIVGSNTVWINNSSGRQSFSGCNFNNLNKWSHLTLSYNQDTGIGKLYVNSKLNCSINLGPGTAIPWNTSNGIYVGGTNSGSYNGPALIDDIKIFPYTLTDEQVKQVYNGGAVNFQ